MEADLEELKAAHAAAVKACRAAEQAAVVVREETVRQAYEAFHAAVKDGRQALAEAERAYFGALAVKNGITLGVTKAEGLGWREGTTILVDEVSPGWNGEDVIVSGLELRKNGEPRADERRRSFYKWKVIE